MQIREMRSALNAGNVGKGMSELPESMPPWAVRNIFERRNGLPLTPLPRGIEVRSLGSIVTPARPCAISPALATESEREAMQRRIRSTQISFLS
jgi:hypothetical protein